MQSIAVDKIDGIDAVVRLDGKRIGPVKTSGELDVRGTLVRVVKIGGEDYVCLTDMAKLRSEDPSFTINHWMRNRMTIEYLGLWETLYNPDFKPAEFGRFREQCGLNTFVPVREKGAAA